MPDLRDAIPRTRFNPWVVAHGVATSGRIAARRLLPRHFGWRRWTPGLGMRKADVINALGDQFGYRRYLEICTPISGLFFDFVDPAVFPVRHRAEYRCAWHFGDGKPVTMRTMAPTSVGLVQALATRERYDLVLVDPHHSYESSLIDMRGALSLLRPGGALVVHDTSPPSARLASPAYLPGAWAGLTYQAYIDFLYDTPMAGACTVDTDFGCSVVYTVGADAPPAWRGVRPAAALRAAWDAIADHDARYAFFDAHRAALLNLVSPEAFVASHPRMLAAGRART
jgi:hypothetical protein